MIKFLVLENAKKHCTVGTKFLIREIRFIGEGVIDKLCF